MEVVKAIQAEAVRAGTQTLDPPVPIVKAARRGSPARALGQQASVSQSSPLTIGETFTIQSKVLSETRRINVYLPPPYLDSKDVRLPVLYMPDGGMAEDFLHVAGLVQVSVGNETMRPFILVGIENTQRRRDMTGPTEHPEDRKIAPQVGGSAAFRQFIRRELMPAINARYRTTAETAIMGESLAGLFVVETFFLEPDLFETYIAFDPSLWWNRGDIVNRAADRLSAPAARTRRLYLANSREDRDDLTTRLAEVIRKAAPANLTWHHDPMPGETHATIYHPAALLALRALFKPAAR
jgi:predicted alpha/beta superfamily hydrolase